MERVPGLPLGGGPLSAAQNDSLGAALGRLYRIPVEHIAAAGISERRFGPSTLPPALTAWLQEACDLSPCQEPALVADAVDAAREWLFRPGLLPPPQLTGLGIADLNPANVLWDGRICRLVDFEYGGLTDPAYDLADHVEHIAARLSGVFDPEALPAAAGASADARERMRAYRPLWAVHWLAMLLPGNGGFRRNPPGTTESQARHVTALIG